MVIITEFLAIASSVLFLTYLLMRLSLCALGNVENKKLEEHINKVKAKIYNDGWNHGIDAAAEKIFYGGNDPKVFDRYFSDESKKLYRDLSNGVRELTRE